MPNYEYKRTPWYSQRNNIYKVVIKNGVKNIGDHAFEECSYLYSVTIPNSVTSFGYCAFRECRNINSITIPNSVTIIGNNAFAGCTSLASINIPNSVTRIGDYAFIECDALTTVTIPNSVTSIENGTFMNCNSLRSVHIPNSVTSIGSDAFYKCTSLNDVVIPCNVTYIGSDAFGYCQQLSRLTCYAVTPPVIKSSDAFRYVPKTGTLYVPASALSAYKTANVWKEWWQSKITIDNCYIITLDHNNGTGETEQIPVFYGEPMPEDMGLVAPTKKGYIFTGYSSKGIYYYDANLKSSRDFDKQQEYTLYANWTPRTTKISLDFQGGKNGTAQITATYGKAMPTDEKTIAPTKAGYIFDGYYSSANGKGIKYYNADMTSTRNWNNDVSSSTLYAYWIYYVPVSDITLSNQTIPVWVGETKTLTATASPANANNTAVNWYSSDDNVATVSSEGVITAIGKGTCTITCTAADGYGAKSICEVTVKQPVKNIALSETSTSLWVGESKTITTTVTPKNANNTAVEWSSSDNKIATVSSKGVITAKGKGTCTITCTAADGYGAKSTCKVTVKQQVTSIALNDAPTLLWVGDTKTITATVTPTTANNIAVEWSSSDNNVATISSEGVITAKGKGTCTITCTAADGYGTKSTCEVIVKQQVSSIALNNKTASIWVGETKKLTAKATPTTANNTAVEWSSSDNNVATVSSEGQITAIGKGTCTITCKAADGYGTKSTCKVTVKLPVTAIAMTDAIPLLWVGKTTAIAATVTPATASNTAVEWYSSDTNIATVSSEGIITAIGKGTCTITCKAADGYGTESTCKVTVKQQVSSIALNNKTASLWVGGANTLKATVTPAIANNTAVEWYSSDNNVATVSSEGIITAIGKGTCTITCKAADGYGTESTCKVTVKQQVSSIALNNKTATLWVGGANTIKATVTPAIADNTAVVWNSSDTNVATVSSEGIITAVGKGTCTITCKAADGYGTESTCKVTVKQQVSSIALNNKTATLWVGGTNTIKATVTPAIANNTAVEWYSSDTNVATVSSEGIITAIGKGTCTITCKAADGYGTESTCKITVKQQVTSIDLGIENLTMTCGTEKTLIPVITPSNADVQTLIWKSSDNSVIDVTPEGVLTAVGPGTATITCTSTDDFKKEISITVNIVSYDITDKNTSIAEGTYGEGGIKYTRTLTENKYATFCLPYDVNLSDYTDYFSKVYVPTGTAIVKSNGTLVILFKNVSLTETIRAGQPFIALASNSESVTIKNGSKVTISALNEPQPINLKVYNFGSNLDSPNLDIVVNIIGNYSLVTDLNNANNFTFSANNQIINTNSVSPYCFYVTINDEHGNEKIIDISFSLDGEEATGLEDLRFANAKSPVYNLNGQRINKAHAQKGIYIKNGKKYANKN